MYTYCLLDYEVLLHGDFFGSIFSFSVTMIEMAALTPESRLTVLTGVALTLSMAVQWNRHNLYVFLVPNIVTLVILIASQVRCPSSLFTMRVVHHFHA